MGSKPALVVVDVIYGFTDPASPLGSECADVIAANICLLDEFRNRQLPIFFTTVAYEDSEQATVFRRKLPDLNILKSGSHWVELHDDLMRRPDEILVTKQWASAFAGTDLGEALKEAGVDTLVVTGLTTSGCVRATVVDGLQHNYSVIVPKEAVGDRDITTHEVSLSDLNTKYADVISLSDALAFLPKN
jgi:nicotinamidase-related amidase